jgi:hypothetical protein
MIFVFLLILLGSFSTMAQTPGSTVIRGIVVDSATKSPIPGARIQVQRIKDSSLAGGAISEKSGLFHVKNISPGTYRMLLQSIGYARYSRTITINAGIDTLKIGTIRLGETDYLTDEVEVTAVATRVEIKGDTTEFKASSYKTDKNASAEDLVRKLPGVEVDASGTVKAQGEQVRRVLVDGKPFFGDDPSAALKNLPSEVVDRVQIFDQMSDQAAFTRFDDGDRTKTMNIVMRADKRNGLFGKLYAGYGTEDRYSAGGNVNMFDGDQRISIIAMSNNINQQNFSIQDILGAIGGGNNPMMQRMGSMMRAFGGGGAGSRMGGMMRGMGGGGNGGSSVGDFMVGQSDGITQAHALGINYSDNWSRQMSVSGSYFFNYSNTDALQDISRLYFLDTTTQKNTQDNITDSKTINHRLNLRMDYTIDSMNSISFVPRLTLQQTDRNYNSNNSTITPTGALVNSSNTTTNTDNTGYNGSADLSWRHRFATEGRTLSITTRASANKNTGAGKNNALNQFFGATLLSDTLRQDTPSEGDGITLSANLAYTEPIHKDGILQIGYNWSRNTNSNDKKIYDFDKITESYTLINPRLSNNSNSFYTTQRPGITYKYNFDQATNLSVGVDYQIAKLDVEQLYPVAFTTSRTFYDLLPNITFTSRAGFTSNIRFNYRTSTNQPSISQLQNVVDNSDPLRLSVGNPDLVQEYTHSLNANYGTFNMMSGNAFFGMINFGYTQNRISNSTLIANGDTLLPGGIRLGNGAQITRVINIDGAWNASSFVTYTFPVEPVKGIKLNTSMNVGGFFQRTPTLINGARNDADNLAITPSLAFASNINENVDFSLSWRTAYTIVQNSIRKELDNNYTIHTLFTRFNFVFWEGLVLSGDFTYTINRGLTGDLNRSIPLLGLGLGKRFLNDNAEIKLSVYDLLNQNQSITRNVAANYIEDSRTNVLQRYLLLTFTYNLRSFGGSSGGGSMMPPGGGGMPR